MALDLRAATKFFLDRAELARKVEKGRLRVLARFGAFVRRSAKSSIRKRKATSKPGQPPTDRKGDLKRLIVFGVDPATRSVVVGPLVFTGARRQRRMAQELLEYGGTVPGDGRAVWLTNEPGRDATGRFVSEGRRKVVFDGSLRYRPRPFMGPAFAKETANSKLAPLLSNSVR